MNRILLLLPILFLLGPWAHASTLTCNTNKECERYLRSGSECIEGFCTNPFYRQGCLKSYGVDIARVRVCSSDDPPEAAKLGYCRRAPLDYMELRILGQNWESAFFSNWILEILMSELLDVPVSIEAGQEGLFNDFYNKDLLLDYGISSYSFDELVVGSQVGDCRKVKEAGSMEPYTPCAHVATEAWGVKEVQPGIQIPQDLGVIGGNGWYIPLFTAKRDPTLVSHVGLRGEENRRKLAETFKRPTTWREYCDEVSASQCATRDNTTSREPLNEEEATSYFVEGLYTGFFRYTEENDCDENPDTCTGHFADFPCSWAAFTKQHMHHLDIALASSSNNPNEGYSVPELAQIWSAANATKSDVMMLWWTPEALGEAYVGSDAEFTRVLLPTPTQECVQARVDSAELCGDNNENKIGEAEGSCDYSVEPLKKLISEAFPKLSMGSQIPEALKSPAYDAFLNFRLDALQYGEIFQNWYESGSSIPEYNLRDATCRWVVENLNLVGSFIPDTFPRQIREESLSKHFLVSAALFLAACSVVSVLVASTAVYFKKSTKAVYYSQLPFLILILTGELFVAIAGLILPLPPTKTTCVTRAWLVNLGFVLQLVPLALRIDAINNLANSGKQMQRVHVRLKRLLRVVVLIASAVVAFLVAWTVLDTPERAMAYELTNEVSESGETIIIASDHCGQESDVWEFVGFGWQAALIVPSLALAFVASRVKEDLNDTKTIGLVFGVHLAFLTIRACVEGLLDANKRSDAMLYDSILLSLGTIVSLAVYLLPKLVHSGEELETEILPDLFLNTTIMVAGIEGFAAWSSAREPIQVFKFLESLFESFDAIAEKYQIFKVETTGECYVAACGIPEPNLDHAVVMARFAFDCISRVQLLSKKFEIQYGPDTSDMKLRIGLHSGPVTGGFMKGKQSRFQLFGDTMTTANIIQSTGENSQIHMSEATANLLVEAGRKKWVEKRETKLQSLEKGELQTYWLSRHRRRRNDDGESESHNATSTSDASEVQDDLGALENEQLWIEWNVEVMQTLLKRITAHRYEQGGASTGGTIQDSCDRALIPLDEVQEIIELPAFDKEAARRQQTNQGQVKLSTRVIDQLRDFVTQLAGLYVDNPFHNFGHASYVVMAVTKFMNRIVAASEVDVGYDEDHHRGSTLAAIHDHTYGITSDPLTQFACVFSALIHDVDHPGVPNGQLIKESTRVATIYKSRSVAEQKSFDVAWDLLSDSSFDDLRTAICSTTAELQRFRQIVINCVMATDLGDEELKELRNKRWATAFDKDTANDDDPRQSINRKATIVIEHLIQAADVAHTCQHWGIYQKWNQGFFVECYEAYRAGRADKNPADYWYEGEIGFFDHYIIPLSKKLRDCGVFGSTSDENLNYAKNNREMWVKEGKKIVATMLQRVTMEEWTAKETEELSSDELATCDRNTRLCR